MTTGLMVVEFIYLGSYCQVESVVNKCTTVSKLVRENSI
jgi:hypothetical protein